MTPSAQAMDGWRQKVELAQLVAKRKDKLIVYAFIGHGWNEPSDAFVRDVLTKWEFFRATYDSFVLVELPVAVNPKDIDETTQKLMKKYKVINVPVLVVTTPEGKKVAEMEYQLAPLSRYIRKIEQIERRYASKGEE
ncbi:hypothetical protein [Sulfuriroseicoccus oceanibius]|uniref:Thioredoxin-like fold domain-containing protein n=1 Tax=Sulfuriroseicoccus oceanibius TaxID=2707525 RepID=A0A6B3LAR4_9BACT|nr:hypothetical protein [Sulfuriroseicoccus oceanibius]QQL44365.1 hypothetical protein G3M56_010780 [Sulfuriroseicoccus oceanibius]